MGDSLRVVSLFAGCGGLCEGARLAGLDVVEAVEWDSFSCETYRHNFPDTRLVEGDVKQYLRGDVPSHLADIDVVMGGPPCQGYSQIGTRSLDDPRNTLYEEFARVVVKLRPRMFLLENVPNILMLKGGMYRDLIISHFTSLGYKGVTYLRVSASDFGVPQSRERVFFFGFRDDASIPEDTQSFAEEVISQERFDQTFTVRQAISDLPENVTDSGMTMPYPIADDLSWFQKCMRIDFRTKYYSQSEKNLRAQDRLHNHHTKEILDRRKKLIAMLKPGAKGDSLPPEVWNGKRPEKWRRLHPDRPSYTILAQMHRDLSEWVHPDLERWITVREAARLQSFHDGFVFKSSEWQMLKQIGNAVPPLLGRAICATAKNLLDTAYSKSAAAPPALAAE